jgi:hypothetical protein
MPTYLYPEASELREIGPNLVAEATRDDILFSDLMPIRSVNAGIIRWQLDDDDQGLQQLRGLDGAPVHVAPLGSGAYASEPGYFGEYMTVTEREMTERAGSLLGEANVDIGDLVAQKNRQLVLRETARIRQIGWTLFTTGTFSISGKGSTLTHTDTFALQTYNATTWATVATATPLADLRAVQQMGSEYGVEFGATSMAIMNRVTANRMFANTNAADLAGRRTLGGGTVTSPDETNRVLNGEDLPNIVIYDKGYKNDSGTFTKFIADGVVLVVGRRMDGGPIAEYRMTRNMNNPGGTPGSYEYLKDYAQGRNAPKETPPRLEIHRGHNGGPVIYRPKAFVIMDVS